MIFASYSPVYLLETKSSTLTIRRFCRGISRCGEVASLSCPLEASNLLGGVLLPGQLQTDNEVVTLLSHAFDNPNQVLSGKTLAVCEAISSNPEIRVFKLIATRVYDSSKRHRSVPCHSHLTKLCCRFKPGTDFLFSRRGILKVSTDN
jgi:hypothetical protein